MYPGTHAAANPEKPALIEPAEPITLYDALVVAAAAAEEVIIQPDRYHNLIVGIAKGIGVGIAPEGVAGGGTTDTYFWAQYNGQGGVSSPGTADGDAMMMGAAGALLTATAGNVVVAQQIENDGTGLILANLCFNSGC